MRKIIYLIGLLPFLLSSCVLTPQKKAEALIEEHVKSYLYFPESYESVSTTLDSATTPFCDPVFHDVLENFIEFKDKLDGMDYQIKQKEDEIESALSDMSLYRDMYSSHYKFKYNQAKKEKEEHEAELKELNEKRDKICDKSRALSIKVWNRLTQERKFNGYVAMHRYRAKNNAGQKVMGSFYYFFDPEVSKIIRVYDPNSSEFMNFESTLKEFTDQMTE